MPSALAAFLLNQLKLIRLLQGEVSRTGAAQDFVDDGCNSTGPIGLVVNEGIRTTVNRQQCPCSSEY
jgi:hypothetical protein